MKHKRDTGPEAGGRGCGRDALVMICVFGSAGCCPCWCCSTSSTTSSVSPAQPSGAVCWGWRLWSRPSRSASGGAALPSLGAPPARGVRCRDPSASHCPALRLPPVYVIIGIFCLASSTGLYSCLSPPAEAAVCKCR